MNILTGKNAIEYTFPFRKMRYLTLIFGFNSDFWVLFCFLSKENSAITSLEKHK
jgi:hypothetical protein